MLLCPLGCVITGRVGGTTALFSKLLKVFGHSLRTILSEMLVQYLMASVVEFPGPGPCCPFHRRPYSVLRLSMTKSSSVCSGRQRWNWGHLSVNCYRGEKQWLGL